MKWQLFIIDIYRRISQEMEEVLRGLTIEDLNMPPSRDANTMGWLCWHATRAMDRTLGEVVLGEQLWTKDKWHARFNMKANPSETGWKHTFEEVAVFKIPDVQTLPEYHHAVMESIVYYLMNLSEEELDREFVDSVHPGTMTTVRRRIIDNLSECFQHIGQAAYVRGLLKGQGWLGR